MRSEGTLAALQASPSHDLIVLHLADDDMSSESFATRGPALGIFVLELLCSLHHCPVPCLAVCRLPIWVATRSTDGMDK